jgi:Cys-tRNA(Pro)/Cys-tRNA(Cys) deacylase
MPATPAIELLERMHTAYLLHQYHHDPRARSFGAEAALALGIEPGRVFKTLVARVDGTLAVAVVPVSAELDTKALARTLGAKRAAMADPAGVERSTGYVLGGVSPLGQKRALPTVIDTGAESFATIFVSGGRRGLEVELTAGDLATLTNATFAAIASRQDS